jgi:D-alanyl-D-alanine carboxypeptidase
MKAMLGKTDDMEDTNLLMLKLRLKELIVKNGSGLSFVTD